MTIQAVVASPTKYKSQDPRATCCIAGPTKTLVTAPIRGASYRQSETEPREPTLSKLHTEQTCLTPARRQALAADCAPQTCRVPISLKTKTPGGNPPALGGPSIRGIRLFYTTNRNVHPISETGHREPTMSKPRAWHLDLAPASGRGFAADCATQTRWGSAQPANRNAGGYPPALGESPNWETQVDYTAAPCELLETPLPKLLEEVLLEVAESAKERHIGLSLQMPLELQVGRLDSANVVCNLGKTIAACNGILIDNRLAGDARCNRPMNRFGHNALPAVACRDIKNAGGNPPALGGPPIRRIQLLYTTNWNVYSILPKAEHMFYTIDTNMCSPYRKAA